MFKKILIANRGEIACRIMHTARKLGIESVAVYSEVDHDERHVQMADTALALYGQSAQESYLDQAKILKLAKAYHIDAIHPGYGFLSENAEFAKACESAGIKFIGPSSSAILLMGSKKDAKIFAEKNGIPTVPGFTITNQKKSVLESECSKIGFPLLIKAASGGGGKGMRIVHAQDTLGTSIDEARREAKASFDDDTLIIEKFLENPRHIECQVFGDAAGNAVHLFERDCSVQRRYQKIIEEAPAPNLSDAVREKIYALSTKLTSLIDYEGAGTVECLVDGDDVFFMEMNTRLQVEHPVTECITGVDLVEWQLLVAAGEPLPLKQSEITQHGHAIEARLYAENPFENFKPETGTVTHLALPKESPSLRIDHALYESQVISPYYDPMLGKLISHAPTRQGAIQILKKALGEMRVHGVQNNLWYLHEILSNNDFQSAKLTTKFIALHHKSFENVPRIESRLAAIAYYVLKHQGPLHYFRLNQKPSTHFYISHDDTHAFISTRILDGRLIIAGVDNAQHSIDHLALNDQQIKFEYQSKRHVAKIIEEPGGLLSIYGLGAPVQFRLSKDFESNHIHDGHEAQSLSPMPGTVTALLVKNDTNVKQGEGILVIEAMKMQHTLTAPKNGRVKEVFFKVGEQVQEGETLFEFEAEEV